MITDIIYSVDTSIVLNYSCSHTKLLGLYCVAVVLGIRQEVIPISVKFLIHFNGPFDRNMSSLVISSI